MNIDRHNLKYQHQSTRLLSTPIDSIYINIDRLYSYHHRSTTRFISTLKIKAKNPLTFINLLAGIPTIGLFIFTDSHRLGRDHLSTRTSNVTGHITRLLQIIFVNRFYIWFFVTGCVWFLITVSRFIRVCVVARVIWIDVVWAVFIVCWLVVSC